MSPDCAARVSASAGTASKPAATLYQLSHPGKRGIGRALIAAVSDCKRVRAYLPQAWQVPP
ncbi:hypothetical protein MesoLj113a_70210 [Mesorhizobium sp. 113-1-2]|nr:hypothetical protein MesoLj113a_70210 [Mesorhizobium sp. 113-1-2]